MKQHHGRVQQKGACGAEGNEEEEAEEEGGGGGKFIQG